MASFISLLTQIPVVFAGRSTATDDTVNVQSFSRVYLVGLIFLSQVERLRENAVEVKACKHRILAIMGKNKITDPDDILRIQYFLHVLRVFEAEMLAQLKQWDQLSQIVTVGEF